MFGFVWIFLLLATIIELGRRSFLLIKNEVILNVSLSFLLYVISIFLISLAFSKHHEPWQKIHLWYSFLAVNGVLLSVALLLIIIFFFSKESPAYPYIKSIKSKVCIPVKPPEDIEVENAIKE